MRFPEPPVSIGNSGYAKTPAGTELEYKIVDEVGVTCDYGDEVYRKVIQVLEWTEGGFTFRFGYYRYTEKRARWTWGQYTLIISPSEWKKLRQSALEKRLFEKYNKD